MPRVAIAVIYAPFIFVLAPRKIRAFPSPNRRFFGFWETLGFAMNMYGTTSEARSMNAEWFSYSELLFSGKLRKFARETAVIYLSHVGSQFKSVYDSFFKWSSIISRSFDPSQTRCNRFAISRHFTYGILAQGPHPLSSAPLRSISSPGQDMTRTMARARHHANGVRIVWRISRSSSWLRATFIFSGSTPRNKRRQFVVSE